MSVGWNEQLSDNRAQMSQCWLVRLFEYVLQKDSFQTFAGIVFLIDPSCKILQARFLILHSKLLPSLR